jgi:hypothetical protein
MSQGKQGNGYATAGDNQQQLIARIFGDDAGSIQSQVTALERRCDAIDERAFGDLPVSLKSRITEQEKDTAVSRGKLAVIVAIISSLVTLLAAKLSTVAAWFGYKPTLPMILYGKVVKFDALIVHCWSAIPNLIAAWWPKSLWLLKRFWG